MKKFLSLLFIILSGYLFSQSDTPCAGAGAPNLAVNAACVNTLATVSGSYQTNAANFGTPPCASPGGPDVWYSFVAPASGNVTITTSEGTITDGGMALYSSDCVGTYALIECDDDDGPGLMSEITQTSLTPGQTYYIRLWDYSDGTGTMNVCIVDNNAGGGGGCSTCATPTIIGSIPFNSTTTTCGACDSYSSADACGSSYMNGDDYVFEYTPTSDENLDIVLSGTGTWTGVFIMDGCPDNAGTSCLGSSTSSSGNPSMQTSTLTAGQTYYIIVSTFPSPQCTNFTINITSYTPPPPTNQDCDGAIPVCQDVYSQANSYVGEGNYPLEIDSGPSCLGSGELNDVWYTFTVQQSGFLCFDITPNVLSEDYDWAVYNMTTNNCSDIYSNSALEVSCNYSGIGGVTGPNNDGGTNDEPCVNVTQGETYVVNVSNFSSSQNGYTLDFTESTADIWDNSTPFIQSVVTPIPCGSTTLSFNFSENVLCSSVDIGNFTLIGPGGPYTLSNLTGPNCALGGTQEDDYTVTVSPPLTTSGNYQLCLGQNSTITEDLCGNAAPPACLDFTITNGVVANAGADQIICAGGAGVSIGGAPTASGGTAPYTYQWTPAAGIVGSSAIANPTVNPGSTTTYTVTVTDAGGCSAVDFVNVTVNPAPTVTINPASATICQGDNVTLTANGAATYSWNTGANTASITVSPAATTTYTVTGNSPGCPGVNASATVTVAPPIVPDFTISGQQCLDVVSINLSNNGTVGTSYQWTIPGGTPNSATGANVNGITWGAAGTYNITLETFVGSCSETVTIPVQIYPEPTVTASGVNPLCNGGQGSVSSSASGTGGYSYTWNGGLGAGQNQANVNPGTYTVTVTDANGCTDQDAVTISEPPALTATINGTNISCNGAANGTATVTATGGTGVLSYNWSPAPGGGQGTATATGLSATAYTVTITDANGCSITRSFTPTEPTLLTLNITGTNISCNGGNNGTSTVTASGATPGYTYSWAPAPGGGQGTNTVTGLSAQAYTVTVTDNNGCTQTASYTPTQPTVLSASITAQSNVTCNGGNNGSVTIAGSNGTPGYQYNIGGGNQASGTFVNLSSGNYTVVVTDNNGCTANVPVTITQPTALTASIAPVTISCNGDCDGQATVVAGGGSGAYNYQWDNTTNDITATTTANLCAGTYTATVTDQSDPTCQTTANVTIAAPTVITSSIVGTNVSCNGSANATATVTASGGTGGLSYNWVPAPGGGQGTNAATGLGPVAYTVTITDGNGCTAQETFTPTQPTALSLSITGTNVTCNGGNNGTSTVTPSGGTPAYSYNWAPAPGGGQGTNAATGLIATTYTVTVTDNNGCTASTTYAPTQPTLLTGTITSQSNVTCNGGSNGSVTVSGVSGTPGYQYNIGGGNQASGTFNGLAAGNYTVVVTDNNGCTANVPVTITQPTALTASIAPVTISCNGDCDGQATVVAGGGSGAYNFSWNNTTFDITATTTSNLCAGTLYTVTVSDQSDPTCQVTASVTPTEPTAIVINVTGTTAANCGASDGTATVNVTGGSAPYSYLWAPAPTGGQGTSNATGLAAGPYTVTVTDNNGCQEVQNINVPNNGAPTVTEVGASHVDLLCNGASTGQAEVSVSGGTAPYTYTWSPNVSSAATASGLSAGTYTVTVSDFNGCSDGVTITITQPTALNAVASVTANVSCNGGNNGALNVNVSGGTPAYSYQWFSGTPAGVAIGGATASALGSQTAGTYYVEVADNNGCTFQSAVVTITEPTAISVVETITDADCNGAFTGAVALNVGGGTPAYTYSWTGPNGYNSGVEDISLIEAGTYNVTVTDNNGCTATGSYVVGEPTAIGLTPSSTSSNCGQTDGSVSVVATGGTVLGAYGYSWTDNVPAVVGVTATVNGLASGTYTVVVTDDNGCTATTTATISDQSGGSVSAATTNILCNGAATGAIDITVTGGSAPFTYAWTGPGVFTSTNEDIAGLASGTYNLTITDNVGCQITDSWTLTQPTVLALSNTHVNVNCNGGSGGSINLNVAGGTPTYTYAWTGPGAYSAATQDISTLAAGTYDVVVTDNNGCTANTSVTITEPTAISVVDVITNVSCNGGTTGAINITVSGGTPSYTYAWTGPNGFTSAAEDPTVLEAGTYNLTLTDNNGCVYTDSYVITEPTSLDMTIAPTNPNCGNADGSAIATASGGTPAYSYEWYSDAGLSANIGSGATINNLASGTYYAEVTDLNGCTFNTSTTLVNQSGPTISVTLDNNATGAGLCNGSATANIVSGGTAPFSYLWDNGETTQTATALCAGNNCVTVTDNNGCTDQACINITQPTGLTVTLTPTNVDCNGDCDGQIATTVTGGVAPYTYAWTHGPTAANLNGLCAGTYDLVVTDNNGNTQNASVTITESTALAVSNISSNDVLCNGLLTGDGSITITGGTPGYTYEWTNSASMVVSSSSTVNGLGAGTYDVTVTDALGCEITDQIVINQPTAVTSTVSSVAANCGLNDGEASATGANGTPGYTYAWFSDAGATSNIGNNQTLSNVASNTYFVVVTDNNGCTDTNSVTVNDLSGPSVTLVGSNVGCNGGITGSINSTVTGGVAPYTYSWSGPGGFTSNIDDISGLQAGIYTLVVTDNSGCIANGTSTLTQPAAITLNVGSTPVSCFGGNDGEVTVAISGGTPAYNSVWQNSATSNVVGNGTIVSNLSAGNYCVNVTDNNGCTASNCVDITTPSAINVVVTSTDANCGQADGVLTEVSVTGGSGNYVSLVWTNASSNPVANPNAVASGTYTYTVTDDNGCVGSASVSVGDLSGPSVSVSNSTDVSCFNACDGTATVTVSGGNGPFTFNWLPNPGSGQGTNSVSGLCDGIYNIQITDANGCGTGTTVTINEPTELTTSITGTTNVSGSGLTDGSVSSITSGGTPNYSYAWFVNTPPLTAIGQTGVNATNLGAGEYCIVATDNNGCVDTACAMVTQPTAITSTLTSTNALCNGASNGTASVTVNGGVAPYTYAWYNSGGVFSGQTSATATGLAAGDYYVEVTDGNGIVHTSANITVGQPTTLSASSSVISNFNGEDVSCFNSCNGSAQVVPSGGTAPYTYLWNAAAGSQTTAIATNLCAGTYNVTVTDNNGCVTTSVVSLTEPTQITMTESLTDPFCFGGSDGDIDITISNGTAPYTYLWNDPLFTTTEDLTNIPEGTYEVVVTDNNGCDTTFSYTLNPATELILDESNTGANCGLADGSVTAVVTQGTGPFTYLWDAAAGNAITPTVNNLPQGCYTVTVTDVKGCTAQITSCINDLGSPTVNILTQGDVSCNGGSNGFVQIQVTGSAPPLSYDWINNATSTSIGQSTASAINLPAGSYTGQFVDNNGCTGSINVTIAEPTALATNISGLFNVTCNGGTNGQATVLVSGGSFPYTYQWSDPLNQTTETASNLDNGNYSVLVTDANGCTISENITITEPAPIVLSTANTSAFCSSQSGTASVAVVSGGTAPYNYLWNAAANNQSNDTAVNLVPGVYNVSVSDQNGCSQTASVVVGNIPAGNAVISNTTNVSCFQGADGTATVSVSGTGTPPYTYQWYESGGNIIGQSGITATGLPSGQYFVQVTDNNGCIVNSDTITINEPAPIDFTFNTLNVDCFGACNGEAAAIVSGGTAPYSYQWNDPLNQSSLTAVNLCSGTYQVVVTDNAGCLDSATVQITEPIGVTINQNVTNANCGFADGQACVIATGGVGGYTYSWNTGSTNTCIQNVTAGTYIITVTDANNCSTQIPVDIQDLNGPQATIIDSNMTNCYHSCDGSATVDMTGGQGTTFTVQWDANAGSQSTPTASNLCAGIYTVTITDNIGCTASTSVTIEEPDTFAMNINLSDPVCFGSSDGSLDINIIGGTAPYTYQWFDNGGNALGTGTTVTGLNAGQYTANVFDANNCPVTYQFNLNDPAPVVASVVATDITCFGLCDGQLEASAINGTAPYAYQWDGNAANQTTAIASGLCENTYQVNVTDANGCTAIATGDVLEPAQLNLSLINVGDVSCAGNCDGFIQVQPAGGVGGYTYSWTNGVSVTNSAVNLCAGSYTVELQDLNGCSTSMTQNVDEPLPISVIETITNNVCNGASEGSIQLFVSGGSVPYSFQWDDANFSTTSSVLNVPAGLYTVDITDANGCTHTETYAVSEPVGLQMSAVITDANCNQSNGAISVSTFGATAPYAYQWNDPNTQTSAFASGLAAGCYNLVITDAAGCIYDSTFCMSDISGPTVGFVNSQNPSCFGTIDGQLVFTASGGTGALALTWTDGNGNPIPGLTGQLSSTTLADDCYTFTATDAAGCVAAITECVFEPPVMNSAVTNTTDPLCFGVCEGTATVSANGGSGNYTYLWNDGQPNPQAINLCAGVYSVTVTDDNGCTSNSTATINQPTQVDVQLTSSQNPSCNNFCDGLAVAAANGGVAPYFYNWSGGQTLPSVNGLCSGAHQVIVTDGNGCKDSVNFNLVNPLPITYNVASQDPTCGECNGMARVVPGTVTGGAGLYTYQWNDVNNQTTMQADNMCPGLWTVTVTDQNNCSFSQNVTLTDVPGPTIASFVTTEPLCHGMSNGSVQVIPAGGTMPYAYNWDANAFNQVVDSAIALPSGTFCVTVTDSNACQTFNCASIGQPAELLPVPDIPRTICYGDSTQIWASASGGTSPYTINWSDSGDPYSGPLTVQPQATTNYCFYVTDANGCGGSFLEGCVTITVLPPVVLDILTSSQAICSGDSILIQAVASGGNGTTQFVFDWFDQDGNIYQPVDTALSMNSEILVSPSDSTVFYVDVSDGCSQDERDSVIITINPVPTFDVNVTGPYSGCPEFTTTFEAITDSTNIVYFDFDCDGNVDYAGLDHTQSFTYPYTGYYDICAVAENEFGCTTSFLMEDSIFVYPTPTANFTLTPNETSLLNPIVEFVDQSQGADYYEWNFGDSIVIGDFAGAIVDTARTTGDIEYPYHEYVDTGYFPIILTVSNQYGCQDTAMNWVFVKHTNTLFAPKGFTPDGNGINDVFYIEGVGLDKAKSFELWIFNRWGELIFTATDPNQGWDGTYRGNKVPDGVYVWKVRLEDPYGTVRTYVGHVTKLQ
ncbi:MAG: gliding motility-associated C-terminal domain-containing protein [Crocinitomicaceae bacterium]